MTTGRILLSWRLALRDLRRRPVEAVLVLVAIGAATAVLTLGLVLNGVTGNPYQATKAATKGPDLVAVYGGAATTQSILKTPGIAAHSGPFPVVGVSVQARGIAADTMIVGRDEASAAVDQPYLTAGSWVRPGAVVLERTFAGALGVTVGDRITMGGRSFLVAGIAVSVASPPYPNLCYTACGYYSSYQGDGPPGLVWATEQDTDSIAAAAKLPLSYQLNLTLTDPASAQAVASEYASSHPVAGQGTLPPQLTSWQSISNADGLLVADEQSVLHVGSWLAALLALASVAVLAGGRMAEQTRRVGLLKAAGGSPGLVSAVLLAEHLILALAAAAAGLLVGWLSASPLASPGAGLLGAPGAASLTPSIVVDVVLVALAVALAATLVPAVRAARTSTVSALADTARTPRRRARLIGLSSRLPVPLLIALRLVARRPRRVLLAMASITITVTGIVAVLAAHATFDAGPGTGLGNPVADRDSEVMLVLTIVLLILAAVNAVFTAWATVLDARHTSAVSRAMGATPQQLTAGLAAAQMLPALPALVVGIPLGIGLFKFANSGGALTVPPAWWLALVVIGTLLLVGGLTAIPARLGAHRPISGILQAELA